ncbi:DUF3108 domain-containing protein [Terrihabitans soli]|uniref:DUF3108 domain-containing protein n=1 Tax=Terrihabitans soli TaxID=708113 RepID=UPI001CA33DF4|nr:DUF3108 domain-containing protein [Terrihabitans soli]
MLSAPLFAGAAQAGDTEFNARYTVRLAILPLTFATGNLKATIPEKGRYTVDFSATGTGFKMSGKSAGVVQANMLWPVSSAMDTSDSEETRKIRLALSRGRVRQETVTPPIPYRPDRIPITQEHRKNVIDPISALFMPVISKNGPAEPSNCDRNLPIFEGTERFDIKMSYLRIEMVKTDKGYAGPAVVCRATYKAISGHRPKSSVQFMEQNRTIEAWLAPVEGTNMLAPWRVSMSTKVGTLILQATEFKTAAAETSGSTAAPTKQADARAVAPAVSETGTPR